MDPLSCLSIAAAVVQFVDFGARLIKGTRDVYISSSGQSAEVIELSTIANNLTQLVQDAESKLRAEPLVGSQSFGDTFHRLCDECSKTRDSIQQAISKLQARGRTKVAVAASSFAVALKGALAAHELEALADRLGQIRQQAMMAVLCLLLGEATKYGADIRAYAQKQADIISTLERIDQTTKKFSVDVVDFIRVHSSPNETKGNEMVQYVMSDKWISTEYKKYTRFKEKTTSWEDEHATGIVRALFFNSMGYREAEISPRYSKTFEWVFKKPRHTDNSRPLWADFPEWLEGTCGKIYWVTGKPGAGKSTLIKFIARDNRLKESLERWARGPLLISCYFSWTAGADKLQKSYEGLLRALLFGILSQRPALVPRVFAARWFLLQLFSGNVNLPRLELDELITAFRELLSETAESFKIALIIDGLDEFEGDRHQIVDLLREANSRPAVKICVSSRPWNVFKDEYKQNPMLQLEKLTRDDISLFVKEKFACSHGFREFEATNVTMAKKIIEDIVDKAEGVFLWVSVVSGLLESSFQEGYKLAELKAMINGLPSEVSDLFCYIWDRTSPRFRAEASQYFQIMKSFEKEGRTPYSLVFWLGDDEVSIEFKASEMTDEFVLAAVASLGRRLMSRTGGLLEMFDDEESPENSRVGFMHRTARDWVEENSSSIASSTDSDFDPSLWILKGEVLKIVPGTLSTKFWAHTKWLLVLASRVKDLPSNRANLAEVLDRLDRQIGRMSQFKNQTGSYILTGDGEYPPRVFSNIMYHNGFPHWCNASAFVGYDKESTVSTHQIATSSACINFLELACQVPIVPYVKHKTEADAKLSRTLSADSGVLQHIILDWNIGSPLFRDIDVGSTERFQSTMRLNLLEFLLQSGIGLNNLDKTVQRVRNARSTFMAKATAGLDISEYLNYLHKVDNVLCGYCPKVEAEAEAENEDEDEDEPRFRLMRWLCRWRKRL